MNKSEVRLGADLFAKRRPARRRHQFLARKRARTDKNLATDGFGDVSRVVVALHETEETRLQPRRAGGDRRVREPIQVDGPAKRLPVDSSIALAQNIVLVFAVAQRRAHDFLGAQFDPHEIAGKRKR